MGFFGTTWETDVLNKLGDPFWRGWGELHNHKRYDKIQDHATYEKPEQYATGMIHVFVNGTQVLKNGEHTGAFPGRVVRGPGWNDEK